MQPTLPLWGRGDDIDDRGGIFTGLCQAQEGLFLREIDSQHPEEQIRQHPAMYALHERCFSLADWRHIRLTIPTQPNLSCETKQMTKTGSNFQHPTASQTTSMQAISMYACPFLLILSS